MAKQTKENDRPILEKSANNFRTAYGPKVRVVVDTGEETIVKQAFKDECDINSIMARFARTGVITHIARHNPSYGEASPQDLREALDIIASAQESFDDLPASLRAKFDFDPLKFYEFVQEPANRPEMASLGLLSEDAAREYLQEQKAAQAQNKAPEAQPGSDTE